MKKVGFLIGWRPEKWLTKSYISDLDSVITIEDGTAGRDYYLLHGGDDAVVSTVGSDEFDVAFDAEKVPFLLGLFITLFLMVMAT